MSASPLVGVDLQMPSETMVLTSMTRSSRSNLPAYPILFPILLVFPDARSSAWKVVSILRVEYPGTLSYGFYAMAVGETPKVAPSQEYLKGGESDSDERHTSKEGVRVRDRGEVGQRYQTKRRQVFELQVMARLVSGLFIQSKDVDELNAFRN